METLFTLGVVVAFFAFSVGVYIKCRKTHMSLACGV